MDIKLQSLQSLEAIIDEIICGDYQFVVNEYNGAPYLQIFFNAPDSNTGKIEEQYSRKWILQYTMCNTEVVRTAYKAMEAVVIHELQEQFTYRGARVFDPHMDVEKLVDIVNREGMQDTRVAITASK